VHRVHSVSIEAALAAGGADKMASNQHAQSAADERNVKMLRWFENFFRSEPQRQFTDKQLLQTLAACFDGLNPDEWLECLRKQAT
jgi:hypothetical protein